MANKKGWVYCVSGTGHWTCPDPLNSSADPHRVVESHSAEEETKVKWLAQVHALSKWWSQDLTQAGWLQGPQASTLTS